MSSTMCGPWATKRSRLWRAARGHRHRGRSQRAHQGFAVGIVRPPRRAGADQLSGLSRNDGRALHGLSGRGPDRRSGGAAASLFRKADLSACTAIRPTTTRGRLRSRRRPGASWACRRTLSSSAASTTATRSRRRNSTSGCGCWAGRGQRVVAAEVRPIGGTESAQGSGAARHRSGAAGLRRTRRPAEHLARHCQADLFLDTFRYNAHTTASDALWAGPAAGHLAGQGLCRPRGGQPAAGRAACRSWSPSRRSDYEQLAHGARDRSAKLGRSSSAKLAAARAGRRRSSAVRQFVRATGKRL